MTASSRGALATAMSSSLVFEGCSFAVDLAVLFTVSFAFFVWLLKPRSLDEDDDDEEEDFSEEEERERRTRHADYCSAHARPAHFRRPYSAATQPRRTPSDAVAHPASRQESARAELAEARLVAQWDAGALPRTFLPSSSRRRGSLPKTDADAMPRTGSSSSSNVEDLAAESDLASAKVWSKATFSKSANAVVGGTQVRQHRMSAAMKPAWSSSSAIKPAWSSSSSRRRSSPEADADAMPRTGSSSSSNVEDSAAESDLASAKVWSKAAFSKSANAVVSGTQVRQHRMSAAMKPAWSSSSLRRRPLPDASANAAIKPARANTQSSGSLFYGNVVLARWAATSAEARNNHSRPPINFD